MRRRAAFGAFLATLAAGLVAPGAASAMTDCGGTYNICIYDNNDWSGQLGRRAPGGGVVNVSGTANDRMDSWTNGSGTNSAWYYDANGTGNCTTMAAHSSDPNINVFASDELTSWRTNRGC